MLSGGKTIWTRIFGKFVFFGSQKPAPATATKPDLNVAETVPSKMTENLPTRETDTKAPPVATMSRSLFIKVTVGEPVMTAVAAAAQIIETEVAETTPDLATDIHDEISDAVLEQIINAPTITDSLEHNTLAARLSSIASMNARKIEGKRRRIGKTGKNRPVVAKKPTKLRKSKSALTTRPSYPGRISALTRSPAPRLAQKTQIVLVPTKSIPKRTTINSRRSRPTTSGQRLARAA